MYLPERVAILNNLICSGVNINMLSRGGGKFVLLVNRTTHVFARGAGNFELFWWKKEGVVQRGVKFVLLVNKTLHVFARGGGKYLPEAVASICRRGWQF